MIKRVEIKNFQSHKHTILEFENGLNVIKGSTHSGKSSIVRALKWALFNKPRKTNFKSYYANEKDSISVSITFDNDITVIREKGKDNSYKIKTNKEIQVYKAIGSNVPEEVSKIINMTDINLQSQGDNYFLLNESPGQRAKYLNQIVGLEIIDKTIKKVNALTTETKNNLSYVKEQIEEIKDKLNEFKNIKDIDRLIVSINDYLEIKSTLLEDKQDLIAILDNIDICQNDIVNISKILKAEKLIKKIENLTIELNDLSSKRDRLIDICNSITQNENYRNRAKELFRITIKELSKIDICPLCNQKVSNWI